MKDIDVEKIVAKSRDNFLKGYNCSQSVAAAFSDYYEIPESVMLKISAGFGGGIGRQRLTCGAVSGMVMVAGLENGSLDGADAKAKGANYQFVQDLCNEFKVLNQSITCAELLNIQKEAKLSATPASRTEEYYKNRPCLKMVEDATRIMAQKLKDKSK